MMMLVAIAALAQAAPALPPDTPPRAATVAPSATGVEEARRLLKAINIEAQYDQAFARLIPLATKQAFDSIKDSTKVPLKVRTFLNEPGNLDRAQRDFADRLSKGFRRRYPTLIDEAARAYAQAFTPQELESLSAFYESTLGKKTLTVLPELQNKMFVVGGRLGVEVGQEAMVQTLEALLPDEKVTS
ncbi:MAG: hypothetical protein A4S16_14115 [Proteobacteria bacterium SG_bin6]|nr:MAG: hypothetical protein A4S16_14115 [Proteobacteria bacterium SG_bin6]